jgi:predicted nucleic acid-binding protein
MESKYLLLDTNIVSYIMKNAPQAELYEKHLSGKTLTISFITVGELWAGAEWANWGDNKKAQLRATICKFVVIPYNDRIAEHYGAIIAH